MTYNQYRMIFYVSFTAFAIMLIASIVILIVLEIPTIYFKSLWILLE